MKNELTEKAIALLKDLIGIQSFSGAENKTADRIEQWFVLNEVKFNRDGNNVWALNNNGDWMWVDGFCKRTLMNDTIDELFRLVQEYKPQEVGIETTGQQGGFISWIQMKWEIVIIILRCREEKIVIL